MGTGVATALKIIQWPTPFLTRPSASSVGRGYSKEQFPPQPQVNRRVHTGRSDPITNKKKSIKKGTEVHQEIPSYTCCTVTWLPKKNLVFGKIKDATNPSRPVGAWYRKNSATPATEGANNTMRPNQLLPAQRPENRGWFNLFGVIDTQKLRNLCGGGILQNYSIIVISI